MEEHLIKRMQAIENKLSALVGNPEVKQRDSERISAPKENNSPDEKRFSAILKEASEEMDLRMEEINMMVNGKKSQWGNQNQK